MPYRRAASKFRSERDYDPSPKHCLATTTPVRFPVATHVRERRKTMDGESSAGGAIAVL